MFSKILPLFLTDSTATESQVGPSNPTLALFLISFLGLFLELLLIRWITTEINIFAYLQNTVLVVCFMGFGIGCMTSHQPIALRRGLASLFLIVLLLAIPMTRHAAGKISRLLSVLGDLLVWDMALSRNPWGTLESVGLGLAATFFLMVLICGTFVPIGRILGRRMNTHPNPISAYSVNIAGSLAGIWCFTLLSVFYQPPFVWLLLVAICFIPFLGKPGKNLALDGSLLLTIVMLAWFAGRDSSAKELLWSPYQKLALQEFQVKGMAGNYSVAVNNTFYLALSKYNSTTAQSRPLLYPPEMHGISQYDVPLLLHPGARSMLIVGSGGGNDVAGALRHGVSEITAVEIDPAIIRLGKNYHGDQPYASPRVRVINDDARSVFATMRQQFDIISFGLLDSHTMTSMTNARLDHYVYTEEALQKAKTLLLPGGTMTLAFEAAKPFIADRMATMLRRVFQQMPLTFRVPATGYGPGGLIFVVGNLDLAHQQLADNPTLTTVIRGWQEKFPVMLSFKAPVTTDDWPYLYLPAPEIPTLYYLLALLVVGLFAYTKWCFNFKPIFSHWKAGDWHFFFLGAGFLLLEVQNISKAAVVLGNTWWVNAVIISGILVMILMANLIVVKFPRVPIAASYAGLIGSCVALYFVDLAQFAFLPYALKAAIVALLAGTPILFSGVIFVRSFAFVIGKDAALGANLIGAMIGGLLQSLTFLTGIRALLLIVTAFYLASLLCRPSESQRFAA